MAEAFADSFKTELTADRVWRSRSQLELAVVEYVAWFNTAPLHSSLDYRTPDEIKAQWQRSRLEPLLAQAASTPAKTPPAAAEVAREPHQVILVTKDTRSLQQCLSRLRVLSKFNATELGRSGRWA